MTERKTTRAELRAAIRERRSLEQGDPTTDLNAAWKLTEPRDAEDRTRFTLQRVWTPKGWMYDAVFRGDETGAVAQHAEPALAICAAWWADETGEKIEVVD